jgi:hypothetical protein
MPEEPTRRLAEAPEQSSQQMVNRIDPLHEFSERRKGLDSMVGVPAPQPVTAQAAAEAPGGAGGQSESTAPNPEGPAAAPVDYDG